MAIEDIFRALEGQADEECKAILDNAKAQADSILEEAREEADGIRQRHLEQAEASVKHKTMQMVNAAKLDNRRKIAALKEQAIADVFEGAGEVLSKMRGDATYPDVFRRLLDEALAGMTGKVEVQVDAKDRALAEAAMKASGLSYEILETPSAGGVTILAGEGRIFRRNTFEDRLAKLRQRSQASVSEILFS
jgi:vacuolar-type H+-ATPase subunit E/Vma4